MPAVWGWHGLTAAHSPVLHGRKAPAGPSQDGAATAAPLGVVQRVHLVFKPVDVVEVRLPQVLVVHFCDGDSLDGLTLIKETEKLQLAKWCLELVLCHTLGRCAPKPPASGHKPFGAGTAAA